MFNGPQIHLVLNHLPVVGFILMTPLVLLATIRCASEYRRLALMGVFLVSLLSLPAYFTGEPAEEGVEDLPGIEEKFIHDHEEAAEKALILALVTGALAGGAWFLTRKSTQLLGVAMPLVSFASVLTAAAMAWTGHEGGLIRHPEIRSAEQGTPVGSSIEGEGETGLGISTKDGDND